MALTDLLKGRTGKSLRPIAFFLVSIPGCGSSSRSAPTPEGMCDEYQNVLISEGGSEEYTNQKYQECIDNNCQQGPEVYDPVICATIEAIVRGYCVIEASECATEAREDCVAVADYALPEHCLKYFEFGDGGN